MVDCEDYVSLSDDDTITEVASTSVIAHTKNTNNAEDQVETIVIDEEDSEYSNVIDLSDSQNPTKNEVLNPTSRIFAKECKLFAEFVEKCLRLENSDGMLRIIRKNLRSAFEECDKTYRSTSRYKKFVKKTIKRLEQDPHHKFSHIKVMVEKLKHHKKKKRVQLTTLAKVLLGNSSQQKNDCTKSLKVSNSIVLDSDDEPKEVPVINLEDDQAEVICLDEAINPEEKENHIDNGKPNSQESYLLPHKEVAWEPSNSQEFSERETEQSILPTETEPRQTIDIQKVKHLEAGIAECKKKIAILEEAEVVDDSMTSPYILCESYKAKIVALYKELCILTGESAIKRRKVRLKVLEGHSAGPVKKLEKFINENIGEDGTPLFPDFCDVVKCVMVANLEDKLGWSKPQVMKEANSLFTQCGRALQKKRQRREYRDLLSRVKTEDIDPAEEDPELMMKLELNKRIATKKEDDLLEEYTMLQDLPSKPKPGPRPLQDQPTRKPETVTHSYAGSSQQIDDNQSISYSYTHVKRLENPRTSHMNSNYQKMLTYTHVKRNENTSTSNKNNSQKNLNGFIEAPNSKRAININVDFEDTVPFEDTISRNSRAFVTEAPLTNENVNNIKDTTITNNENKQPKPSSNNDARSEEAPTCNERGINTNIDFEDSIPFEDTIAHNSRAFVTEAPLTNENLNNNKDTAVSNDEDEQSKPSSNNDAQSEEAPTCNERGINTNIHFENSIPFEDTIAHNSRDFVTEAPLTNENLNNNKDTAVSNDEDEQSKPSSNNDAQSEEAPTCNERGINTNIHFENSIPFEDTIAHNSRDFVTEAPLTNENLNNNKDTAVSNDEDEQSKPSSNNDAQSEEDSDFELPEVSLSQEIEVTPDKTDCLVNDVNKVTDGEVKIKQEQIDIVQMLEELGDDYTVSVFDIQDPTFVIEISSDSSDEEIQVDGEDSSDEEMQVDGEDDILEDLNSSDVR